MKRQEVNLMKRQTAEEILIEFMPRHTLVLFSNRMIFRIMKELGYTYIKPSNRNNTWVHNSAYYVFDKDGNWVYYSG